MKIKVKKNSAQFAKVSLTLTFETQKELDVYATLFNLAPIQDVITDMGGQPVDCSALANVGGDSTKTSEMLSNILNHYSSKSFIRRGVAGIGIT